MNRPKKGQLPRPGERIKLTFAPGYSGTALCVFLQDFANGVLVCSAHRSNDLNFYLWGHIERFEKGSQ